MKIHILSDEMASRIAAGEVVERPASVVKELIENSLDAGATEISISIEKSGTVLVRVADNVRVGTFSHVGSELQVTTEKVDLSLMAEIAAVAVRKGM